MTQQMKTKYRNDYFPSDYKITKTYLDFDLKPDDTIVTATSTVICQGQNGAPLALNGENLHLLKLQVNNQEWSHYHVNALGLVITELPNTFTLTIKTLIHPSENTTLEGIYLSGNTLCTQCEAEGFRRITFYLDRPDVLAQFTTRIMAEKKRYPFLLSNGNCIDFGNDGNFHWVIWEDPFPKPCYLFALVAGNFDVLRDNFVTLSGKNVDLEMFVNCGNLDKSYWAMESLKQAMRWDEIRFGLEYDLDIYMIVAVDFFNMGAMENKGLNIFNSKYVLADAQTATDADYLNIQRVIGHEYFHNWTGNRITCRDWFQLSLKEGLTVFRDQEFSSDLGSRAVNRIKNVRIMRSAQFSEDASTGSHPVCPDRIIEINNLYTLTVYEKGAEIIRMLHTILGKEKFREGMRRYIFRHDMTAATCEDFIVALEDVSNIDLTLFRRWYNQSGTPLVTIRDDYNTELKQYTLHITQITPPTPDQTEKKTLHIPLHIELYNNKGKIIPLQCAGKTVNPVLGVTKSTQTFIFDHVPVKPTPSLLGEFSAPVKLDYPYNDQQLIDLMHFSTSDFIRWDSAQRLLLIYIRLNVLNHHKNLLLPIHVIDAFRNILLNTTLEPALIAQILTLPSENEIANLFTIVDPIKIHEIYLKITKHFANSLKDELLTIYSAISIKKYQLNQKDIGLRSLRNCCVYYLAFNDQKDAGNLISEQYHKSDNMTDTLSAITASVVAQLPCTTMLLADFEKRWYKNDLVMDKWFYLHAISPSQNVLHHVKSLLNHSAFSLNNPNRVRALIGAFTTDNPAAFHTNDGSGYTFLVEVLTKLNTLNPQISSRMIEPLIQLNRYDSSRQQLMRAALEKLKTLDNLSDDLFEKISQALSKNKITMLVS